MVRFCIISDLSWVGRNWTQSAWTSCNSCKSIRRSSNKSIAYTCTFVQISVTCANILSACAYIEKFKTWDKNWQTLIFKYIYNYLLNYIILLMWKKDEREREREREREKEYSLIKFKNILHNVFANYSQNLRRIDYARFCTKNLFRVCFRVFCKRINI